MLLTYFSMEYGMMPCLPIVLERRCRERYPVKKGALAFKDMDNHGQILNVSLTGLRFQYPEYCPGRRASKDNQIQKSNGTLDIVFASQDFTLVDLPVRVIVDQRAPSDSLGRPMLGVRCCSVQFGKLSREQAEGLSMFLKLNGVGLPE